jgi:hypothetical protein
MIDRACTEPRFLNTNNEDLDRDSSEDDASVRDLGEALKAAADADDAADAIIINSAIRIL